MKRITYHKFQKVGSCTYITEVQKTGLHRKAMFMCECGNKFATEISKIKNGHTKSCGCKKSELCSRTNTKHGISGTPAYQKWGHIIYRCYDKNCVGYKNYGGRGIVVCDEWRNDPEAFSEYILRLPNAFREGYSIDRIDNNGNYKPGNIRWADRITQNNNTRKTNK